MRSSAVAAGIHEGTLKAYMLQSWSSHHRQYNAHLACQAAVDHK